MHGNLEPRSKTHYPVESFESVVRDSFVVPSATAPRALTHHIHAHHTSLTHHRFSSFLALPEKKKTVLAFLIPCNSVSMRRDLSFLFSLGKTFYFFDVLVSWRSDALFAPHAVFLRLFPEHPGHTPLLRDFSSALHS